MIFPSPIARTSHTLLKGQLFKIYSNILVDLLSNVIKILGKWFGLFQQITFERNLELFLPNLDWKFLVCWNKKEMIGQDEDRLSSF